MRSRSYFLKHFFLRLPKDFARPTKNGKSSRTINAFNSDLMISTAFKLFVHKGFEIHCLFRFKKIREEREVFSLQFVAIRAILLGP